MHGSVGRRAGLILAGLAVLVLSFWVTLTVIDSDRGRDVSLADVPLTNEDGSPRSTRATSLRDLPPAPAGLPFGAGWDGVDGLNVLVLGPGPTGGGNLALSLVATREPGNHRLGLNFVGVPTNRPIKATAWIKAPKGTRLGIDVRDGQKGAPPKNTGSALLDLWAGAVLTSTGSLSASVETGPGDWIRVPIRSQSADGVLVIYYSLIGGNDAFAGSGEQFIFGGIEITAR